MLRSMCLVLFTMGVASGACPARAATVSEPPTAPAPLFTRSDAWFGAASMAGVLLVGFADGALRDDARMAGGASARRLGDLVRPLGTPQVLAPGLLLGFLSGHVFGRPGLTSASVRIAAAVGTSGLACEAIKMLVGRERPYQSPSDIDEFRPFSGHDSFPSGHTTVAFAAAAGIDRETTSRWVPWVVYPVAGLVGWSRVHDDLHWTSDTVAGAALGIWCTLKVEGIARRRDQSKRQWGALVSGGRDTGRLGVRLTF